jgi:hypothetical protein
LGRVCLARHPLTPNAKAVSNQQVPGGENQSYADGHAGRLRLEDIKTVIWHVGWVPMANPWNEH